MTYSRPPTATLTRTPQLDSSKPSYEADSRPPTPSVGSSYASRQTLNEDNVRKACAKQGMYFEVEASYDKYPEFREKIESMVFGDRESAMRTQSLQNIKKWRKENATNDEESYFAGLIPKTIHTERSFGQEVEREALSFSKDDGLDMRQDCLFVHGILPLRTGAPEAQSQGVTTPQPDLVFGLKVPQHPKLNAPILKTETEAQIGVARGIKHPFFSINNKGSQHSIEAAENQAMRSGATMVNARRLLNRKAAKGKAGPIREKQATDTSFPIANTNTADDAAMSDPFIAHATATTDTATPTEQATEVPEEPPGVDTNSFAFTCSLVPQMANLHVHWCELYPDGSKVYHMNLLRGYLMSDDVHVSAFRKDVHNILDYGVSTKRKETLEQLELDIARFERGGR